jgi:glycine/D-amino acid oxidase-like deaminating enzyme
VAQLHAWGLGEDDYRWLEPDECDRHARIADRLGGSFTPHCAALHPSKLVRGLARVVEARGVRIYEQSPVTQIEQGAAVTARGRLRARTVVRATEAYTRTLDRQGRLLLPIHSMMIATEPLPDDVWKQIGLDARQTFGDDRRITIYGQRTTDGRIAFGGRAGYFFGSRIGDRFAAGDPHFERVHRALLELFPALHDVQITHRWGGALGVPRSWAPSLGLDRATGLAWLGGYVGQGVAASNAAGRTLAELIVERETERTGLAWVGRAPGDWEPEPLRWLAVRSLTACGDAADRAEEGGGRAPLRARLFRSLTGR